MSFLGYASISLECSLAVVVVIMISMFVKSALHAGALRLIWLAIAARLIIPLRATLFIRGASDVRPQIIYTQNDTLSTAAVDRVLTTTWLIGAMIFFAFHFICYFLTCRRIKGKAIKAESLQLENALLAELEASRLELIWAEVTSPLLVGFLRPRLILPEGVYNSRELNLVISHELCHYRSHDIWLKLLLLIANALNWFNPGIYLMMRRADSDIESACDARVLQKMPTHARKAYAGAILRTIEGKWNVLSPHFLSPRKEMRNRFLRILHGYPHLRNSLPVIIIVIGVLIHSTVSVYALTPKPVDAQATKVKISESFVDSEKTENFSGAVAAKEASKMDFPVLPVDPAQMIDLHMQEDKNAPMEILTVSGARVSAPISGEVVRAGYNSQSSGGIEVEIAGEMGRAILRHLGEINIKEGESVEQGAMIGRSGQTGAAVQEMCSLVWLPSTEKHLD